MTDSTQLVDTLSRLAAESLDELPEVVVVHERIGPVPALELIREVALRFPAVGVVLVTSDASPGLFQAAMDHGARGLVALPLSYEELASRVQAVAQWSAGVRRHLGAAATRSPAPAAPSSPSAAPRAGWAPPSPPCSSRSPPRPPDAPPPWSTWTSRPGTSPPTWTSSSAAPSSTSPRSPTSPRASSPTPSSATTADSPCSSPPPRANAARRSPTGPPATSSAPCAPATRSSSSTAAPSSAAPARQPWRRPTGPCWSPPRRHRRTRGQADRADVGPAADPQGGGDHGRRQPAHPVHGDPAAAHRADHRHRGRRHHDPRPLQGAPGRGGRRARARTGGEEHRETGDVGAGRRTRPGAGRADGPQGRRPRGDRGAVSFRRRRDGTG